MILKTSKTCAHLNVSVLRQYLVLGYDITIKGIENNPPLDPSQHFIYVLNTTLKSHLI